MSYQDLSNVCLILWYHTKLGTTYDYGGWMSDQGTVMLVMIINIGSFQSLYFNRIDSVVVESCFYEIIRLCPCCHNFPYDLALFTFFPNVHLHKFSNLLIYTLQMLCCEAFSLVIVISDCNQCCFVHYRPTPWSESMASAEKYKWRNAVWHFQ